MGLAGVGWREGEKMQTIVTELKKKRCIEMRVELGLALTENTYKLPS